MKRTELQADLRWLALSLTPNIGGKTLHNLLCHFDDDLDALLGASESELLRVRGVGPVIASEIRRIDLGRLAAELERWRAAGLRILEPGAGGYPQDLSEVADAPPALFAMGLARPAIWAKTVAIVGRREPTPEARFITLRLAMQLARAGYTVVSGLALGIDSAAHAGALAAQGVTVAVLGSGLLNVYPEANRPLAARIGQAGLLLSEVHPGWGANAQRLVSRNRIISGLSRAVILVESNIDGGAMYTARFAREQGKPLFTFDLPAGGNQTLIRQGAEVLRRDDPLAQLPE